MVHDGVVFDSDRSGRSQIWLMYIGNDGTSRVLNQLTYGSTRSWEPSFSCDGTIAYVSDQTGYRDIYTLVPDIGSGIFTDESARDDVAGVLWSSARVTAHKAKDEHPTFSADGKKIFFRSERDDRRGDIYSVSVYGLESEAKRLTIEDREYNGPMVASPDGAAVAFVSKMWDGKYELFSMPTSGGSFLRLTSNRNTVKEGFLTYSRGGEYIYYEADNGDHEIHRIATDGLGGGQLTFARKNSGHPSTAPNRCLESDGEGGGDTLLDDFGR